MNFFMRCIQAELIHLLRRFAKDTKVVTFDAVDNGSATIYLNLRVNGQPQPLRLVLMNDGTWAMESTIEFSFPEIST